MATTRATLATSGRDLLNNLYLMKPALADLPDQQSGGALAAVREFFRTLDIDRHGIQDHLFYVSVSIQDDPREIRILIQDTTAVDAAKEEAGSYGG